MSLLLHGWLLVPWLAGWLGPLRATHPTNRASLKIRLLEVPRRLAGEPTRPAGAAARTIPPRPSQPRPAPLAPQRAVMAPSFPKPVAASLPDYPRTIPRQRLHPRPSTQPGGEGGQLPLEPPVLLKGPQHIGLPPFLRNRDGHFLMTLRCRVDAEGGAQVEVMEGTGAPDLDEAVRASFSGLPWYRAELAGRPVAMSVRLVIEGRWRAGEDSIDWGGRTPRPQF